MTDTYCCSAVLVQFSILACYSKRLSATRSMRCCNLARRARRRLEHYTGIPQDRQAEAVKLAPTPGQGCGKATEVKEVTRNLSISEIVGGDGKTTVNQSDSQIQGVIEERRKEQPIKRHKEEGTVDHALKKASYTIRVGRKLER